MLQGFELINHYYLQKIPFVFIINYEKSKFIVKTLHEIMGSNEILIQTPNYKNFDDRHFSKKLKLKKKPISKEEYKKYFDYVMQNIIEGNSYLTNLTFETPIEINLTLEEIFYNCKAKYKICVPADFVCFTPESFIKINGNIISTYPMKGTIDKAIPNAANIILEDEKEKAEHYTIVDLLRNDLSRVAENVVVKKFRFIDEIKTENNTILQVSSEIIATILPKYKNKLGALLNIILPAGSITGAPKAKTIDILANCEAHKRNFYTGIFGIFDGEKVDSAVMIRFIEKRNNNFYYKSGGGITHLSNWRQEHNEMTQKIYVPIF